MPCCCPHSDTSLLGCPGPCLVALGGSGTANPLWSCRHPGWEQVVGEQRHKWRCWWLCWRGAEQCLPTGVRPARGGLCTFPPLHSRALNFRESACSGASGGFGSSAPVKFGPGAGTRRGGKPKPGTWLLHGARLCGAGRQGSDRLLSLCRAHRAARGRLPGQLAGAAPRRCGAARDRSPCSRCGERRGKRP